VCHAFADRYERHVFPENRESMRTGSVPLHSFSFPCFRDVAHSQQQELADKGVRIQAVLPG
jgi:hypothetical protein